jgi:hypothetical protein
MKPNNDVKEFFYVRTFGPVEMLEEQSASVFRMNEFLPADTS